MASPQPRIGVVTYPGSQDDRDALWALAALDAEAVPVWHEERELPDLDAVVLPGGFSYGDYLRCGAIARLLAGDGGRRRVRRTPAASCSGSATASRSSARPGSCRASCSGTSRCASSAATWRSSSSATTSPFTSRCTQGETIVIPVKHGDGRWFGPPELVRELEANRQVVLRYGEPCNGSVDDIAGICNERGNVIGLMPHPEHAVDPLLGSADGALILASLVEAAREHALGSVGRTPKRLRRPAAWRAPRAAARRRARRKVTGPRRAVPSVAYAKRTSRSPPGSSSSWTSETNRRSPACCRTVSSSTSSAGPHGVAVFGVDDHGRNARRRKRHGSVTPPRP